MASRYLGLVVFLAGCTAACSSATFTSAGSGGSGGGSGVAGSGAVAGSGGAAGSAGAGGIGAGGAGGAGDQKVDCSKQPIVFPNFIRACSGGSASCAIVVHQTDCCGTQVATGINHAEKLKYTAAEKLCESQYPPCGCASQAMTTDTGQTVSDIGNVQVECKNNVCTTYIP